MRKKLLRNPSKPNMSIRVKMYENGIQHQELAKKLGLSKQWVCQLLSKDLSPENKERFDQAIEEISKEV